MARPRTEIEVTVLDRASGALRRLRDRLAGLNNGRVGKAMEHLSRATAQSGRVLAAYGAVAGVAAAGGLVLAKSVMNTASEFERYRTILETLEGGADKAKESMGWISDFAAKTPYELNEVTDAFVKLKAYGMDPMADGLLNTLGDTAAAMGKPVMQAVEAIADAVTGENERLKEFGIKASKIKGSNEIQYRYTDKDGVQRLAKAAADNREQIQKTLQTIWNEKYGGSMDKLSATWEGMISNLSDQWARFKLMIAEAGVFDYLKDKLGGLLETINAMAADGRLMQLAETVGTRLVDGFKQLWDVGVKMYEKFIKINDFMGGFENTLTALGVVALLPLVAAIANIGVALGSLGVALAGVLPAVRAFTAALLANPITWIIGGLVALGAAVWLIYKNWDKVSGFLSSTWEKVKSLFSQGFEYLKSWFFGFTPLGWMIKSMAPMTPWLQGVWEKIKSLFGHALSALGNILSSFDPLGFVRAAFDRLLSFVGGIFDGITSKARQILNLSQDAQASAPGGRVSPGAVVRGNGGGGRVDVNINHGNVPRGTTMSARADNRVNLKTKQGYAFG